MLRRLHCSDGGQLERSLVAERRSHGGTTGTHLSHCSSITISLPRCDTDRQTTLHYHYLFTSRDSRRFSGADPGFLPGEGAKGLMTLYGMGMSDL